MKKVFLFLLACCWSVAVLDAQSQQVYNVPSPEVANLGLYGQVPVSYYTGVPDISVPLYEVKVGNFSMPITASYHIGSVKPNQTPGPLGLGWSLIAGGYITRSVRLDPDEYIDQRRNKEWKSGLYENTSKLKEVKRYWDDYSKDSKNKKLKEKLQEAFALSLDTCTYELSADEFSFDCCGYSGNFYLNEEGGWTVVSDYDVKIEFDPNNGFIDIEDFRESKKSDLINTGHWSYGKCSKRFFSKFAIIAPDGTRYEFGGLDAMEFSIPYYDRNSSPMYATTWRLTKIITPDKRTIRFEYESNLLTCELQYMPRSLEMTAKSVPEKPKNWWRRFWKKVEKALLGELKIDEKYIELFVGRKGFSGDLIFPVQLKKIITPNETIELIYQPEENSENIFWRDALYWREMGYASIELIRNRNASEDPASQFSSLINISSKSVHDIQKELSKKFSSPYLSQINVQKKCNRLIFDFSYVKSNRRKLSTIVKHTTFSSEGVVGKDLNDSSFAQAQEYHFKYNTSKKMPAQFGIAETDCWGFYHGENNSLTDGSLDMVCPNLEASQAEILTEMQFPTGGRTCFEYEQNRYSWSLDSLHQLVRNGGIAGGLRLSKLIHFDINNRIISKKKFYYSKMKTSECSGILRELPITSLFYDCKQDNVLRTTIQKSRSGYMPPVTNMNSPIVGYSWVIEETLDSMNNSIGYVRYHYSNYDEGMDGKKHLDEPALLSANRTVHDVMASYTSLSFERGKLLSKEFFDKRDVLYRKEVYNYSRTSNKPLFTASQNFMSTINYSTGDLLYTHTASYLPVSVTESIRSTTGEIEDFRIRTYDYNEHKTLKRETSTMSDGTIQEKTYTYPFDYSKYNWMTNANITSPVIEKRIVSGSLIRTETETYASANGVPYVQKLTMGDGSKTEKTKYEVLRVDEYGNPVEMVVDGIINILCWGCQGQRLMARVENVDYAKVKYLLNLENTTTNIECDKLLGLVDKLPSALFHFYRYTPDLQLLSETSPNGMTTFYNYDKFGRLTEMYYVEGGEKKLLKRFDYQYYKEIK
jgi:YD repeat-containing protein